MSETGVHDVDGRHTGGVELCVASSGRIHWSPSFGPGCEWVTDDTVLDDEGRAVFGINVLFARVGEAVVVVDPSSWPPDETALGSATLEPGADLDTLLDAARIDAEEVTHVAITHGHPDHEIDWAPVPGRDTATLRESRLRIFREAADGRSSLVFTHGRFPGWGSIEQVGKEAWQWSYL